MAGEDEVSEVCAEDDALEGSVSAITGAGLSSGDRVKLRQESVDLLAYGLRLFARFLLNCASVGEEDIL